ncbi:MAG: hypothetical protein M0C28_15070 [Candidatus Moduliflexus flocculans]|nr:hypothetical protein [Candidatus Moduliflexus flocculans]
MPAGPGRAVLVAGGSGPAVLYGAYQLAEKLGVRFSLEGDVVPDGKIAPPAFDLDETGQPLFAVRGIQPFHDFPEGPDWWTLENYKAVLSQLPKLRMNFFGLHTYPENPSKEKGATPNAEPTVWIGREGDFGPDGKVTAAYPASYQNTARGNWGYEPKRTGDFHFGASLLFERDDFGNDVMDGFSPDPAGPAAENEVFDRAAAVFKDAFSLARRLGVKTCVGTETPLTVPAPVRERLTASGRDPKDPAVVKDLYKAMFGRIAAAYPVDYYWFWTWEGWTWDDAKPDAIEAVTTDLAMGVEAWREAAPPFKLATCGWVLGPPSNRTLFDQVLPKDVAMSTINREVGKAPVDPGFARIEGRSLWAIPWMEDDPALTSPQLWAGRMRRDAADALRYGCDGLLGIHWRTRVLSANVLALARAAWDQGWNTLPKTVADDIGPITGEHVSFKGRRIAGAGTRAAVYRGRPRPRLRLPHPGPERDLRRDAPVRRGLDRPGPRPRLRRLRAGPEGARGLRHLRPGRQVQGLRPQGRERRRLRRTPGRRSGRPDPLPGPGRHRRRRRRLRQEDQLRRPGRPRLRGGRSGDGAPSSRARPLRGLVPGPVRPGDRRRGRGRLRPRRRPPPVPVTWIGGPGNIQPDPRAWDEVAKSYAFVDELAALEPRVAGPENRERFDYWLASFRYMREVARFNCLWAVYNKAVASAKAAKDDAARRAILASDAVPVRIEMAAALRTIYRPASGRGDHDRRAGDDRQLGTAPPARRLGEARGRTGRDARARPCRRKRSSPGPTTARPGSSCRPCGPRSRPARRSGSRSSFSPRPRRSPFPSSGARWAGGPGGPPPWNTSPAASSP